jgi:hypothetical protein
VSPWHYLTLSQEKHKNIIDRLASERPDECRVKARNQDGSILAAVPVKWIKISPPRAMSEEQRAAAAEHLRSVRPTQEQPT